MSIEFKTRTRGEQLSSFQNATLQETRDGKHSYSIAVYIALPAGLTDRQVERRIRGALSLAAARDDVAIEVQVGRD